MEYKDVKYVFVALKSSMRLSARLQDLDHATEANRADNIRIYLTSWLKKVLGEEEFEIRLERGAYDE